MNKVYFYSVYERVWHWMQALVVLALIVSGAAIHWPGAFGWPFARVVSVHNILGFVLIGNAFLGLFYHLSTGEIRQYVPAPRGFISLSVRQARFYLRGIFRGEAHPVERSPLRKLNPLQQATYLLLLNVAIPMQVLTGVAMWGAAWWPGAIAKVGGLAPLAATHLLFAWLMTAFLVVHVYLTTTGPTPLAYTKAMVSGWEAEGHVKSAAET